MIIFHIRKNSHTNPTFCTYTLQRRHGQVFGFQLFILVLKTFKLSAFLYYLVKCSRFLGLRKKCFLSHGELSLLQV